MLWEPYWEGKPLRRVGAATFQRLLGGLGVHRRPADPKLQNDPLNFYFLLEVKMVKLSFALSN